MSTGISHEPADFVLVGGGLQNGLIALAVLERRPDASLLLIERDAVLGGNHTWCFHAGDVPDELRGVAEQLTTFSWPGYDVKFPNLERTMTAPYAGTTSSRLNDVVSRSIEAAPNARLLVGTEVTEVASSSVTLASGEVIHGALVVDARGPENYLDLSGTGYQKFVGVEVRVAGHGLERPVLMDATVSQRDGFRFYYTLPLSPDTLLVEDTIFSRNRELDVASMTAGCLQYARSQGFDVSDVLRSESGALPMPWQGQHEPPTTPLRAGYQGGWFHPATGYSFPIAARLAAFVGTREPAEVVGPELAELHREQMSQVRFCHRLNRMLFQWFHEGDEWNVFERFYKLPDPLIRRFYALEMTVLDRTRLLVGRPPKGFSLRARLAGGANR